MTELAAIQPRVKPIIFSAPMIRAIFAGRKTMTRRILKDQETWDRVGEAILRMWHQKTGVPYAVGDLLWVREAWNLEHVPEDEGPERCLLYWRADEHIEIMIAGGHPRFEPARALAQRWRETWTEVEGWRPAIHMPRWASRITLEVEAVKLERLQEISGQDAIAEGIDPTPHRCGCERCAQTAELCPASASSIIEDFGHLWDSLHGAGAWEANPWVAEITFRVHQCNVDRLAA